MSYLEGVGNRFVGDVLRSSCRYLSSRALYKVRSRCSHILRVR